MSWRLLALIISVVVVDQGLKLAAVAFHLPYLQGELYHPLLALAVTVVALWGLGKYPSSGLALIVGGGGSNLLDLLVRQQVLDIFTVKNFAFNLADICIVAGFLVILGEIFYGSSSRAKVRG